MMYVALPAFLPADFFPSQGWIIQHVAEAQQVFAHGSYLRIRAFEIAEITRLLPLHASVFPRTAALMTFGVYAWRIRVFDRARALTPLLTTAVVGLLIWTGMTIPAVRDLLPRSATLLTPIALAAFYASLFLLLISRSIGRTALGWFAPVGRMAFSNYITQSVVLGLCFYGFGLGLCQSFGPAKTLLFCIGLFAVQAVGSTLWLRRFRFGPLEWLWRAFTYGRSAQAQFATLSS